MSDRCSSSKKKSSLSKVSTYVCTIFMLDSHAALNLYSVFKSQRAKNHVVDERQNIFLSALSSLKFYIFISFYTGLV